MKIAFVKPPIGGILGLEMLTFVEPLGPISVAACLEPEGHECKVIDLRLDGEEPGMAACREFAPQVVGLQCNFTTERNRTRRLAQRVKREMPGTFVVVGGHDASREPEWFADPAIDAVAVGDGEEVMPPLVDALDRGGDLAKIPGLMLQTRRRGALHRPRPGAARPRRPAAAGAPPDQSLRPPLLHQFQEAPGAHGDRPRLPLQVQLLLGVEVPRVDLPREVAGAGGRGAARPSRPRTSSSPTTSSG